MRYRRMAAVLFCCSVLGLWACSLKSPLGDEFTPNPKPNRAESPLNFPKDEPLVELDTVYFDTNKSDLNANAKKAIQKNVEFLKKNPEVSVQVEGLCDERGSREYNFKLGERRAQAVVDYMKELGIEDSRLSAVSYGAIGGQTEKQYSSSRRAISVLIYPAEVSKK